MPKNLNKSNMSQRKRFVEAAREVGASEDPLEFERVLRGIAKAPPTKKVQARKKSGKPSDPE